MAIFRASLDIGFANSHQTDELEIPDEELAGCSGDEARESLKFRYLSDWAGNYIDMSIWETK